MDIYFRNKNVYWENEDDKEVYVLSEEDSKKLESLEDEFYISDKNTDLLLFKYFSANLPDYLIFE